MIERDIAGATQAHRRLLDTIDGLTDHQARAASSLAGWTVGHVLTHLARNADSHVRLIDGAARGEVWDQYVGGIEGRAAEIEAGAARPAAELVDDVRTSGAALEARWARVWTEPTPVAWSGHGLGAIAGPIPIDDLPFRRWREVEVHHADLGLGFGPSDWSAEYVRLELNRQTMTWSSRRPMGLTELPPLALALPPHHRLAWLLGRLDAAGLPAAGVF